MREQTSGQSGGEGHVAAAIAALEALAFAFVELLVDLNPRTLAKV